MERSVLITENERGEIILSSVGVESQALLLGLIEAGRIEARCLFIRTRNEFYTAKEQANEDANDSR